MLNSKELRNKAWASLKGKYWNAFLASFIAGLILSVSANFGQIAIDMSDFSSMVANEQLDEVMTLGLNFIVGIMVSTLVLSIIIYTFVDGPFKVGYNKFFIKNTQEKPELKEIFSGFRMSYMANVKSMFLVFAKIALWSLLFLIPGIIKSFEYAMVPYILAENPGMSSKEVFAMTKKMMDGNKFRLFKLELSFIGWFILAVLTCGIGTLFLLPYYAAAHAEFYQEVKGNA